MTIPLVPSAQQAYAIAAPKTPVMPVHSTLHAGLLFSLALTVLSRESTAHPTCFKLRAVGGMRPPVPMPFCGIADTAFTYPDCNAVAVAKQIRLFHQFPEKVL